MCVWKFPETKAAAAVAAGRGRAQHKGNRDNGPHTVAETAVPNEVNWFYIARVGGSWRGGGWVGV